MRNKKIFDILIIVFIFIICIGYTHKQVPNDTFYTIKVGESIMKNGVDMIDHFSIHDLMYTYPHWLYDLSAYLIYNTAGFQGLYYTTILLYFIIGTLLYILNKNLTRNRFTSGIFSIAAVICLRLFITVRAQTISYILFILELFFINKFLITNNKKYLIPLPIISIIIVNTHCAVWPFFFLLFLPCIVEQIICWYRDKKINTKFLCKEKGRFLCCKEKINMLNKKFELSKVKDIKYLVIIMIICIFTGVITLNGLTPYTYLINTFKGSSTSVIVEHMPSVLTEEKVLIFILCTFLFAMIFLKTKIKLRDAFLMTGLFILAFNSNRHISLLVICGIFVIIKIFSDYLEKNNPDLTELCIKTFTQKYIALMLTILIIVLSAANYFGPNSKIYSQDYIADDYPIEAANYIVNNLDVNKIRLFNEYNYGSYLIYRDIPVFIDSRADLYTKEFNKKEKDILNELNDFSVNYKNIFEYYGITHAIIYKYHPTFKKNALYRTLEFEKYKVVYEDDYYAIFEIKKV